MHLNFVFAVTSFFIKQSVLIGLQWFSETEEDIAQGIHSSCYT